MRVRVPITWSLMITSWNGFCFVNGSLYIEVSCSGGTSPVPSCVPVESIRYAVMSVSASVSFTLIFSFAKNLRLPSGWIYAIDVVLVL